MKIVTVIPLQRGPINGDLTYFTSKAISPGNIATISIRNKELLGLVIGVEEAHSAKGDIKEMNFNLKKIIEVKESSLFLPEFLSTAIDIGKYFATKANNALSALMPALLRSEYDQISAWKIPHLIGNKKKTERIRTEKLLLQMPLEERLGIYKTLIRENFALKKSVFLVLPTEHDVDVFFEALSKGIEQFIFSIHGGLSTKKMLTTFENIMTSDHPILIVGTATFLSVPRRDLGVIILEHESSSSYKMVSKPNFDLRVFVELLAARLEAKLILSDTLLRFETIAREDLDHLAPMHNLNFRLGFDDKIEVLGSSRKETGGKTAGKFQILLDESKKQITETLKQKKNVFVFSLRKGLATMTVCRDCAHVVACPHCSAPVVLYLSQSGKKRMFICNKCKTEMKEDTLCQSCGSWNLMPLGIGTDTVSEHLKEIFPNIKIYKIDKESVKTAKEAEKMIKEFEQSEGAILVGTEMAMFYIKESIPLSVVASFDSFWSIPNFKISEKIVQLMLSISSKTDEKLIIQTKNIEDGALLAIQRNNLLPFIRSELEDRESLSYPPYKRFIKIKFQGDKTEVAQVKEFLAKHLQQYEPEIFSGFLSKQKGLYVVNSLIKLDPKMWSYPELSAHSKIDEDLCKKLMSLPPEFEIFVDPEDLL